MPHPAPAAIAALADAAARLINGYAAAGQDSTGQDMVKLRKAAIEQLQAALAEAYPDPTEHSLAISMALIR